MARLSFTYALISSSVRLRLAAEHDERLQSLPELLILDADRRGLLDLLVAGEQLLDLGREHVLAAGDDHLVVASVDEQPALVVEVADVP